jgi:reactive intermediate/imine deaminase
MIESVSCANAPAAIGPYSQAVLHGNTLYISGQLGFADGRSELVEGIAGQAEQILKNINAIAKEKGSSINNAIKLTLYLTDLNHFSQVNELMAEMLSEPYPARATVEVSALPKGALIEVEAVIAC